MAGVIKNDRRVIFGWAMYDWANSSYATTSGAIVAPFFTGEMLPENGVVRYRCWYELRIAIIAIDDEFHVQLAGRV